jgi:transposase-like protein
VAAPKNFLDQSGSAPKAAALNAPPSCPKCGSKDTSSAAKRPTAQSYWRCLGCGEVWNPSLLADPRRGWWQR